MLIPLLALAFTPQMQMPAPATACAATPVTPTGELSGWAHGRAVNAAARPAGVGATILQPGVRADVTLLPSAQVTYAMTPQKTPPAGSYSGLLGIDAARAGTYRVALGAGAWVNVIAADGRALTSTGHGHGPDCSGIRKIVDFTLRPGQYVVQIEGNGSATIGVMLVAKA